MSDEEDDDDMVIVEREIRNASGGIDRVRGYIEDEDTGEFIIHTKDDTPSVIRSDGTKEWHDHGSLHREDDKHAIERASGTKEWYYLGDLHRKNGPAIERTDGSKEWFFGGMRMNKNGPSIIRSDGTKEWLIHYNKSKNNPAMITANGSQFFFNQYGLHRDNDLPAVMKKNADLPDIEWTEQQWYKNGKQHRDHGPSTIEIGTMVGTKYDKNFMWYYNGEPRNIYDVIREADLQYLDQSITKIDATIDLRKEGYDIISMDTYSIGDYIRADPDNIVFLFLNHAHLTTKQIIREQLNHDNRESNVFFGCRQEDTALIPRLENIESWPFMTTRSFMPIDIFVYLFNMAAIIHSDKQIFIIETEGRRIPASASLSMIRNPNANAVSSAHCGPGSNRMLHRIHYVDTPDLTGGGASKTKKRARAKRTRSRAKRT